MSICRFLAALPLLASLAVFAGETEEIQQLMKNRQLPQALERADRFLVSNPKDAQVRFLRGIIQTELGKPDEAIKTFSALSTDYPQLPEPYNNLAVLYAQQGQLDKARASLLKAIQTNPAYAIAHENLGDLYARLASQSYDKALQLGNTSANVQTKLTLVRELFSKAPQIAPTKQQTVVAAAKPTAAPTAQPVKPVVTAAPPAATAQPKPTAPAATAAPQADARDEEKAKVLAAVNNWADSWSNKNANGYLAAYERDYRAPNNQKYNDWAKERRERIAAPKSISVKLSDLKVEIQSSDTAKVKLRQSYKSDRLSSTTSKTLILKKSGGRWLIHEERTGG